MMSLTHYRVSAQPGNGQIETAIKKAIGNGIMKRDGYRLILTASQGQDTARIRAYYENLIKSSGKPYTFEFAGTGQNNNNGQNVIVSKTQPTQQVNTNINTPSYNQSSVCYARQTVFGILHYTDRTENYIWIVPDGVTQIWIEAWSGGGNGYSKFVYNTNDSHKIDNITGGGGGGGAYASVMLSVQKGEKLIITIPPGGGGKSVEILLNDKTNSFYLNNGGNGDEDDALKGKGYGGISGGNYGRFTNNNVFWIGGQKGGILSNAYYHYEPPKEFMGQKSASVEDINIENFGNGGSAPYLNNGGRGAQLHATSFAHYYDGQNGGFPGGGGGGGVGTSTGYSYGKGAPGLVIIHF
jgi:hypothetical protein